MDQFIDDLLVKDRVCATSLWKMPSRQQLEDLELLDERISPLGEEIDEIDADEVAESRSEGVEEESGSEREVMKNTERTGYADVAAEDKGDDRNGSAND